MRQKSTRAKEPAAKTVQDIRRRTRKQYSAEEKIRIVECFHLQEAQAADWLKRAMEEGRMVRRGREKQAHSLFVTYGILP